MSCIKQSIRLCCIYLADQRLPDVRVDISACTQHDPTLIVFKWKQLQRCQSQRQLLYKHFSLHSTYISCSPNKKMRVIAIGQSWLLCINEYVTVLTLWIIISSLGSEKSEKMQMYVTPSDVIQKEALSSIFPLHNSQK